MAAPPLTLRKGRSESRNRDCINSGIEPAAEKYEVECSCIPYKLKLVGKFWSPEHFGNFRKSLASHHYLTCSDFAPY
jgi:hypothetical protein